MEKSRKHLVIKAILFDLDGTIVDTEPLAAAAIQAFFKDWNIQLDLDLSHQMTGRTWESAFALLKRRYPLPISDQELRKQIMEAYQKQLEENLPVIPGSVAAIHTFHKAFPLGLVSGSRCMEIEWILQKLELRSLFRVVLGAEDYQVGKPHPEGFQKAMSLLQVEPQHCLIFEDSTAGIAAGKAAGAWVTALTSTNHFGQDLSQADFKIRDFSEVNLNWVQNLSID